MLHHRARSSCRISVLDVCAGGGPHQGMSYDSIVGDHGYAYFLPSISVTVATTRPGSNPNLSAVLLSGADGPSDSMPMRLRRCRVSAANRIRCGCRAP